MQHLDESRSKATRVVVGVLFFFATTLGALALFIHAGVIYLEMLFYNRISALCTMGGVLALISYIIYRCTLSRPMKRLGFAIGCAQEYINRISDFYKIASTIIKLLINK